MAAMKAIMSLAMACFCVGSTAADTLEMVQILHRHGDRGPFSTYPTDPHKDYWKEGLAELTNLGKKQLFNLGLYIRARYAGFLNDSYSSREILVNSSSTYRTIMSSECLLAGLYAPADSQVWNPDIDWQPVPIFSQPLDIDFMLTADGNCPKINKLLKELKETKERKESELKNAGFYALLNKKTGLNMTDESGLWTIYDSLVSEQNNNLTWPSWAESLMPEIKEIHLQAAVIKYQSPITSRLRGGPLLGHMIDMMAAKIENASEHHKLYIYSSHDTLIEALTVLLNISNGLMPPPACALFVELHRTDDENHVVRFFFRNSTEGDKMFKLEVPGCPEPCTFTDLATLTNSRIPDDIYEECELTPALLSDTLKPRRKFKPKN